MRLSVTVNNPANEFLAAATMESLSEIRAVSSTMSMSSEIRAVTDGNRYQGMIE
jgi:hypothetical protein